MFDGKWQCFQQREGETGQASLQQESESDEQPPGAVEGQSGRFQVTRDLPNEQRTDQIGNPLGEYPNGVLPMDVEQGNKAADEADAADEPNPSCCCGGSPACVLCFWTRMQCMCCVCICLILLVVAAYFVFPRCVTAQMDNDSFEITLLAYAVLPVPSVQFGAKLDVLVDNENYWGITVDTVKVYAKYKGAVLATSSLKNVGMVSRDEHKINVKLQQDSGALLSYAMAAPYFVQDCGINPTASSGTWKLDVEVDVNMWDSIPTISFDTSFDVPCYQAVGKSSATYANTTSGGTSKDKCLIPGSLGKE